MVGQFVGGNREQVSFQRPMLVEVRQAGQEPDERLLHEVLGRRLLARAALDIGQQPALEPGDQFVPRLRVTLADAANQQSVDFRGPRHQLVHNTMATATTPSMAVAAAKRKPPRRRPPVAKSARR